MSTEKEPLGEIVERAKSFKAAKRSWNEAKVRLEEATLRLKLRV